MCVQQMIAFISVCTGTTTAEWKHRPSKQPHTKATRFTSHVHMVASHLRTQYVFDIHKHIPIRHTSSTIIPLYSSQQWGNVIEAPVDAVRRAKRLLEGTGASARRDGVAGRASWVSGSELNKCDFMYYAYNGWRLPINGTMLDSCFNQSTTLHCSHPNEPHW